MKTRINKISKIADALTIIAIILYTICAVLRIFSEKKQEADQLSTTAITPVTNSNEVVAQQVHPAE